MTTTAEESRLKNKSYKERAMCLFLIEEEIAIRCGDGTGTVPQSHSINCRCVELNRMKKELLDEKS